MRAVRMEVALPPCRGRSSGCAFIGSVMSRHPLHVCDLVRQRSGGGVWSSWQTSPESPSFGTASASVMFARTAKDGCHELLLSRIANARRSVSCGTFTRVAREPFAHLNPELGRHLYVY